MRPGKKNLAGWRERLSGLSQRAALLEELEKRHEGVERRHTRSAADLPEKIREGPFQQVRGLLADLLQVSVETAPMIEAALGEKAQHMVVSPGKRLIRISGSAMASDLPGASDFCRSMLWAAGAAGRFERSNGRDRPGRSVCGIVIGTCAAGAAAVGQHMDR